MRSPHLKTLATDRHAQALFALSCFLTSVFLLNGSFSIAIAVLGLVTACWWLAQSQDIDARMFAGWSLILPVFLALISIRLSLPPYGDPNAVPASAVVRTLLLAGLFGLTLYVCINLSFRTILNLLVIFAFLCTCVAFAIFVHHPPDDGRLIFLGRAAHAIFGAGVMATSAIAAVSLLLPAPGVPRGTFYTLSVAVMLGTLVAGILLTGSRGPIASLALALIFAPLVIATGSRTAAVVAAAATWLILGAAVLGEGAVSGWLCPSIEMVCRPSARQAVWAASVSHVADKPILGWGYGYRFAQGVPHAHNGILGMALHYGIPLTLLFVALMALGLCRAVCIQNTAVKFFCVASLIFASGFMGSDLSDPVRLLNTHYIFLWFPLFVAIVSGRDQFDFTHSQAT